MNESVAKRIEIIAKIFRSGQIIAKEADGFRSIVDKLDQLDIEFRAVGYEGAAMELISSGLRSGIMSPESWNTTLPNAPKYRDHILIGYGWAIADAQFESKLALLNFNSMEKAKIMDGYGYYHGLFHKRNSVLRHSIPEEISLDFLPLFDKGIGRALWYISKGDMDKVIEMASSFSNKRQNAIWIGVGVAFSYVGGPSQEEFERLVKTVSQYSKAIKVGAILAYLSRLMTDSLNEFAELYCGSIFRSNRNEVLKNLEPSNYIDHSKLIQAIIRAID